MAGLETTGRETDLIPRSTGFLTYTIPLSKISVELGPISEETLSKYIDLVNDYDGARKCVESIILGGARDAIGQPFDDPDNYLDKVQSKILDGLKPHGLKVRNFIADIDSIEFQKFFKQMRAKAAVKAQELKDVDECLANPNLSVNHSQGRENTTCIFLFAKRSDDVTEHTAGVQLNKDVAEAQDYLPHKRCRSLMGLDAPLEGASPSKQPRRSRRIAGMSEHARDPTARACRIIPSRHRP